MVWLRMLEAAVKGLARDANEQDVVLLKHGKKILPIWIGPSEALSIAQALTGTPAPRPMTHDLFHDVLRGLGAFVYRVYIDRLENSTYYAKCGLLAGDKKTDFDSRPSDAIALALRFKAPIFISESLLRYMIDDDDAQTGPVEPPADHSPG